MLYLVGFPVLGMRAGNCADMRKTMFFWKDSIPFPTHNSYPPLDDLCKIIVNICKNATSAYMQMIEDDINDSQSGFILSLLLVHLDSIFRRQVVGDFLK